METGPREAIVWACLRTLDCSRASRARCAAASARFPKTVILLWLLLVAGFVTAGAMTGTKSLTGADAGVGESAQADEQLAAAGLQDPAVESVLIRSSDRAATARRRR